MAAATTPRSARVPTRTRTRTSQARKKFEQNVYPIIKAAGAVSDCSSCHSAAGPAGNVTGFVAPDLADAYATATSYQVVVGNFAPNAAGILTKIAAGHQGRTYTPGTRSTRSPTG